MVRALAAMLGVLGLVATAPAGSSWLVAAHRGGAALWPENSPMAFRSAVALGVDVLEFDVHLTADGEPVVIHDATLSARPRATAPSPTRRWHSCARCVCVGATAA
jgi:glycerophosphoryl diester phosphodiesterase